MEKKENTRFKYSKGRKAQEEKGEEAVSEGGNDHTGIIQKTTDINTRTTKVKKPTLRRPHANDPRRSCPQTQLNYVQDCVTHHKTNLILGACLAGERTSLAYRQSCPAVSGCQMSLFT